MQSTARPQPSIPEINPHSPLGPLKLPVFRMLWLTWLAANTSMWMNDVAAAWLMTSLAPSPLWVAMVQAASTLPVFLLALPSGAMADIVDRKRFLMITQLWLAGTAILLCVTIATGHMNAQLLLLLVFCNGVGLALRWPVFSAIIPEVLPKRNLSQGLALNGISMNASRIVGPLVAGAIISAAGSMWVFVLNAALSMLAAFNLSRWRREHRESPLGRERLPSAMRVGLQYVRQSHRMRAVLVRIAAFFFHSTAVMALLPLVARGLPGGGAGTFTLLLASMGTGAIFAALLMPHLRSILPLQRLIMAGTALTALATLGVAFAPGVRVAVPAMFVTGMAWIATANSLTLSAQMALPDWVRARGMSIYQMFLMGATASGAAVWGQVATWTNTHYSLAIASFTSMVVMVVIYRLVPDRGTEEDLTPSLVLKVPDITVPSDAGRILVRIEYLIDPERAEEFKAAMERTKRSRLRQGALDWHLVKDLSMSGRYVEEIIDESWTEHLRRFDRVTADDVRLRDERMSFHTSDDAPVITRYMIEPV